eukprot:12934167-Prorocentrum_lima.AAC.1
MTFVASRQGEQQALINCKRNEQFTYSEYQQSLVDCRSEMSQGVNYLQAEVTALQVLNKFQSVELNAQRNMMHRFIGHVDRHVSNLSSHFREEAA